MLITDRHISLPHVEVLRFGVMRNEGGGGLFGIELEVFAELDADGFGVEQRPDANLIFQSRAGGVAKAVA